jgi:tetratricopeptide (TPR) repeat protein
MRVTIFLAALGLSSVLAFARDDRPLKVRISVDFPGGNAVVLSNASDVVVLTPDLRSGKPWFYWCFDATPQQPGLVKFVFPGALMVGVRGPAVSLDGGDSWNWLGTETVHFAGQPDDLPGAPRQDSFAYAFTAEGQRVRFAVGIPYLNTNLQTFLAAHAANPHLARGVLTQTRLGRPVALLQIGKPGPGIRPMLVTARHHACEALASYVLEGFLAEALSDSPGGLAFRKRHVLYAVPMMDGDGVEAGDQGKGRSPHDHNRDYGQTNIYPEVKAVQALARSKQVEFVMDFHCPALRGDVHEVFYFDGIRVPPIERNVDELRGWLDEELPAVFGAGPANFMKRPPASVPSNGMPCSIYFAGQPGVIFSATLESPYSQPSRRLDADMARAYGRSLLAAWCRTAFKTADGTAAGGEGLLAAALPALRADFQKQLRSQPQEAERMLAGLRADPQSPAVLQLEADLLTGMLQVKRQQFAEADTLLQTIGRDARATARQQSSAVIQRALAAFADPGAPEDRQQEALTAFEQLAYAAPEQKAQVYGAACACHQRKGDFKRALDYANLQRTNAPGRDLATVLNSIASLQESMGHRTQAIETRQEAVRFLRAQPPGRSIFSAVMAGELCIALHGIPTATPEEKREAFDAFMNHPVSPDWLKERVQEALKPERLPR